MSSSASQAPVDSPERFFVEIQFSNGANFDPTKVAANRHTLPTQNRRLLSSPPGVTLQAFQVRAMLGRFGLRRPCDRSVKQGGLEQKSVLKGR